MTVNCLNCGGKGYVVTAGYSGIKHPLQCPGCHGTGKQTVRT